MSTTPAPKGIMILTFIELGLTLLEKFLPMISTDPTITVEQQKDVMRRVAAIRSSDAFSGPEWEAPSPTP